MQSSFYLRCELHYARVYVLTVLNGIAVFCSHSVADCALCCRYTLGPFLIILIMLLPWLWIQSRLAVHATSRGTKAVGQLLDGSVATATFQQFMSLSLFTIFFVYPPVSRLVIASFLCKHYDVGLDNDVRYLAADHRLDCDSSEYTAVKTIGAVFCVVWPLGAPLFLLALLYAYKVPQMAKRKIAKSRSVIHFCQSWPYCAAVVVSALTRCLNLQTARIYPILRFECAATRHGARCSDH